MAWMVSELSLTAHRWRRDGERMLELRPNCEHCDVDLPPDALGARICTFECTFCADCGDRVLQGICPNCGGELVARPVRTAAALAGSPASADRVHSPADLDAHRALVEAARSGRTHARVALLRYAECWRRGDLAGLVACYAPGFTLHYFGTSRFAGTHRGLDAALALMAEVSALAPRELRSVDEVLSDDDGGALVVTESLTRDGATQTVERVLRYRVEDGLLAECWLHEVDQAAVDRAWS